MPRKLRQKGEHCTYHIAHRGNERKNIFNNEEDKQRFIETLSRMKCKYNFELYAYCLMDNHFHLIIYDNGSDISKIIHDLNVSYTYYFNKIHKRSGHLFQDRFISEVIESDIHLLQASKYVHCNPVKAGLVSLPEEYLWSSTGIYLGLRKDIYKLVDTNKILESISESKQKARTQYYNFVKQTEENGNCLLDFWDDVDQTDVDNSKVNQLIKNLTDAKSKGYKFESNVRNEMIVSIRYSSNLSIRDIAELFGLSASNISKILRNNRSAVEANGTNCE